MLHAVLTAVTIIPCTDLSIGSWRRIATTSGNHDLVAYVCDVKRCLTWFIQSAGLGFKMEIPFDIIIDTEFTNAAPGTGLASFLLSKPPRFFLEHVSSPRPDGSIVRQWRACPDWTEGHQASQVLRHDLIGSAVQLAHFLRNLRAGELPPPLDRRDLHRKRLPYPGPGLATHSPDPFSYDGLAQPQSAPTNESFSHHPSYAAVSGRGTPASSSFGTPMYNDYAPEMRDLSQNGQQPPRDEYSAIRISHGLTSRPYPVIPTRTFYDEPGHTLTPSYQPRRSHSSGSVSHAHSFDQNAPSPPLLTTPYHPPPHILENLSSHSVHTGSAAPPIISGLAGIPVYGDQYQ